MAELYNCASTVVYADDFAVSKAYIGQQGYVANVTLEASSNLGSITLDGVSYDLPFNLSKTIGTYYAEYSAARGYMFDHWETVGQIYISNMNAQLTIVIIFGNGILRAVTRSYVPVLFEDGFESGNFSAWSGTRTSSGENATVVNDTVLYGNYSAMFVSDGGLGFESACSYLALAPSSELYARGYVNVVGSGITNDNNRFYLITLRAGSNNVAYAGWRKIGGVVRWNLLVRNGTGWASAYSSIIPSLNRSYSVELHWVKNTTEGYSELWVDGALVMSILKVNTSDFGSVDEVRFGLAELYNCASTVVYADDFVASKAYIGPKCSVVFLTDPAGSDFNITFLGQTYLNRFTSIFSYSTSGLAFANCPTGWVFDHWEVTGNVSVTDSIVTITGDGTLKAQFVQT